MTISRSSVVEKSYILNVSALKKIISSGFISVCVSLYSNNFLCK